MHFYLTHRPDIKDDGTLDVIKPHLFKKKFPGFNFEICYIASKRSSDGRHIIEVKVDDGHTQQEKDDCKSTVLGALGWDTSLSMSDVKNLADSMSNGTWTINGDKLDPPA